MLRIKKEHLNKRIGKTNRIYVLSADLSQKELEFVRDHISIAFVEEYDEELERAMAEVEAYMKNNEDA
jgi:hypothetical protein